MNDIPTLLQIHDREVRQRGIRTLTVKASPMSYLILKKHSFLYFDDSKEYDLEIGANA